MTVIPFKRRSSFSFRGLANARNAMAFASIILVILLYVIWTSTGNSQTAATSSTTLMLSSSLNSLRDANKYYNYLQRAPSSSSSNSQNINNDDTNNINNNNAIDDGDLNVHNNNAAAAAAVALAPILLAAKIAGAENFIVADDHKNSKKFNVIFNKDEDSHSADNDHILFGNNFDGGGDYIRGDVGMRGSIDVENLIIDDNVKIDFQGGDKTEQKNANTKSRMQSNVQNVLSNKKHNQHQHHSHHHRSNSHYPNHMQTYQFNSINNLNNSNNHINNNNNNIKRNNNSTMLQSQIKNNIKNGISQIILPKSGKTSSQLRVEQSIAAAAAAKASKPAVKLTYKKFPSHSSDKKRNVVKAAPETLIVNDSMDVCTESFDDNRQYIQNRPRTEYDHLPIIYFVTPTYPRREQIPELTRLGQTLMHVPRIHWIVADDFDACNSNLDFLLNTFGVPYTHISSPMPDVYRAKSPNPRGVANRRAALNWIRNGHHKHGVLYFGDDDNTFDLKLFSEIRDTKKVSMFPVGLIGLYAVSAPVVKNGKVIGFFDSWPAKRKWPVDMAGFAVNVQYLSQHPNATMPYRAGYEEDAFLRSISLKIEDIEPKAANCTEILVWHTQTQKSKAPTVRLETKYIYEGSSSLAGLFRELEALNVSHHSDTTGVKAQISRDGKARPVGYYFR